ncbi:glycine--tRNA ligase [Candidatus Woesearchaeota archaeon]|nr:glycine--tRNA ligase [Candidatus Woesearchaeota archaeon]
MATIEELAAFCKKKGLIYPSSEIYGGLAGFFDYGPLGVELKNNIKAQWWKTHVHDRDDIVGIDGSIITNPKVWVASGHADSFTDALIDCSKCGNRVRGDQFIEEKLKMDTAGLDLKQIDEIVKNHKLKCPKCSGNFKEATGFNLMFKTSVGPAAGSSESYLRPETAQVIFADFKQVTDTTRLKLPFGIAQIGRAFRNEISPRDFLFRCREFEQMEIEYFIRPDQLNKCPYIDEWMGYEMNVLSAEMQAKKHPAKSMKARDCLDKGIIKTAWHAYWLSFEHNWLTSLGVNPARLRIRQHLEEEKSHYALDTWDLEYHFPTGWREIQGMANRTDLQGVERAFLVFLLEAYHDDKSRGNIVLKLHPQLTPYKAAVFPLVSNKPELLEKSKEVYRLIKPGFNSYFDQSGSVGRRYARADEIGVYTCVTVDFQTLEDETVTIRSRDTTKQVRTGIKELKESLAKFMQGEKLESLGAVIS